MLAIPIALIHNIDNRKCMPLLHNAQNIFTRHELCLIKNASGTNRTMYVDRYCTINYIL